MENHTNRQMDITGDIYHIMAVENKCTLREINAIVKDEIYEIVWKVLRVMEEKQRQSLLFK